MLRDLRLFYHGWMGVDRREERPDAQKKTQSACVRVHVMYVFFATPPSLHTKCKHTLLIAPHSYLSAQRALDNRPPFHLAVCPYASTTMPSIVAALVLVIGALAGRIDAQGIRSRQIRVGHRTYAYVNRMNRTQMQVFPFRVSLESRAMTIRHSSPSAISPATARRAPFAATPWPPMRAL